MFLDTLTEDEIDNLEFETPRPHLACNYLQEKYQDCLKVKAFDFSPKGPMFVPYNECEPLKVEYRNCLKDLLNNYNPDISYNRIFNILSQHFVNLDLPLSMEGYQDPIILREGRRRRRRQLLSCGRGTRRWRWHRHCANVCSEAVISKKSTNFFQGSYVGYRRERSVNALRMCVCMAAWACSQMRQSSSSSSSSSLSSSSSPLLSSLSSSSSSSSSSPI